MIVLYIDKACVCHPSNYSRRWLLTDFGFSSAVMSGKTKRTLYSHGTPGYRGPELIEQELDENNNMVGGAFAKGSDIWAVGCILYGLATTGYKQAFASDLTAYWYAKDVLYAQKVPQLNETHNPNLKQMTVRPGEQSIPAWIELNKIIRLCLSPAISDRPKSRDLLMMFEEFKLRNE